MGVGPNREAAREPDQRAEEGKFLSFSLGNEEYAIDILKVQEIIGLVAISPVPQMPACIRGVLNLGGRIIPFMDLRSRIDLPRVDDTNERCVIVIREEECRTGGVVDKISEMVDISRKQAEAAPSFGLDSHTDTGCLEGIARYNRSVKLIVNVPQVVFDMPVPVYKSQDKKHPEESLQNKKSKS